MVANLISHCDNTIRGIRDRCILTLCFAGAFRVSELVALNIQDITFCQHGVKIRITKSKTDQMGKGSVKYILAGGKLFCPVVDLKSWLEKSELMGACLTPPLKKWIKMDKQTGRT